MTCRSCTFTPPCTTLAEMRERHGSPFAYARTVSDCEMLTDEEVQRAVDAYRVDWQEMADAERRALKPVPGSGT